MGGGYEDPLMSGFACDQKEWRNGPFSRGVDPRQPVPVTIVTRALCLMVRGVASISLPNIHQSGRPQPLLPSQSYLPTAFTYSYTQPFRLLQNLGSKIKSTAEVVYISCLSSQSISVVFPETDKRSQIFLHSVDLLHYL